MKGLDQQAGGARFKKAVLPVVILILICAGVIGVFVYYDQKKEEEDVRPEFSAVNQICELATLKCYYHDVAEYEKQPDGFLQNIFFKYGYKKFWIEYDGIIEIGIDAGSVQVKEPDEHGVVKIYVPEAKILNVDADLDSMERPISDTGIFTEITANEQSEAFSMAQAAMKSSAQNDVSMLKQAQDNAKELLKQYVLRVGEQMGQTYTIEWINKPSAAS